MPCSCSCEVRDWVLAGDGSGSFVRTLNEAANVELVRRGLPDLTDVSGELVGDAIVWTPTPEGVCGAAWIELGTTPTG